MTTTPENWTGKIKNHDAPPPILLTSNYAIEEFFIRNRQHGKVSVQLPGKHEATHSARIFALDNQAGWGVDFHTPHCERVSYTRQFGDLILAINTARTGLAKGGIITCVWFDAPPVEVLTDESDSPSIRIEMGKDGSNFLIQDQYGQSLIRRNLSAQPTKDFAFQLACEYDLDVSISRLSGDKQ